MHDRSQRAAASFLRRHHMPTIDGTMHPRPRIAALREFLDSLSVKLGGVHGIEPGICAVIAQVADRPERTLVETLVLRSLALAVDDEPGALRARARGIRALHVADPPYPDL